MNLPEDLHLHVNTDLGELCIKDAQEIEWVLFRRGGNGDPVEWATNIVKSVCRSFGIDEAWTIDGDDVELDKAINLWLTQSTVEDGFLP